MTKYLTKQLKQGGFILAQGFGGFGPWLFGPWFISLDRSSQLQKFIMKDLCHGGREAETGGDYGKSQGK